MALSVPSKIRINLLYPQNIPQKLSVKFFKWLLSIGRYIAVFVEIVVLLAFAARFKLDAELNVINEEINKQIPYLEEQVKDEVLIRQTQFKLTQAKTEFALSPKWQEIISKIAAQTPQSVIFNTLIFEHQVNSSNLIFRINGKALTNNDLALLVSGLKSESKFQDIDLSNISLEDDGITFTISGSTK